MSSATSHREDTRGAACAAVLALVFAASLPACVTAGAAGTATPPRPRARPTLPLRQMMDACWPDFGVSAERVLLTFYRDGGKLTDITFEAQGGTSNAVGRCLQQVAWLYPWDGGIPDTMEVTPPAARPSGWTYLAYSALLSSAAFTEERGLMEPAPLVRACLEHGDGVRPHLRYRVQTNPVRVTAFVELEQVDQPGSRRTVPDQVVTDSERCVAAVLASAVYPGTRNLELEFNDRQDAPPSASVDEVAPYFPPAEARSSGMLSAERVKEQLSTRSAVIGACWESALARRSGLYGARSLRLHVKDSGELEAIQVVPNASDLDDEAVDYLLDRCLIDALKPVRFAPVPGGADVTYSWVFQHR